MASSPRNRRPPSSARSKPAPPVEPLEDDLSVELPDEGGNYAQDPDASYAPAEESPETASGSSSQALAAGARKGRSSRRMTAASDRRPSRRVTLSPEEQASRRKALLSAIKLAVGLIILVGAFFAVWWFLLRDDPKVAAGKNIIAAVQHSLLHTIDQNLDDHKPTEAEANLAIAHEQIDSIAKFDRADQLNPLVAAVKAELTEREDRLVTVKHDVRVQQNLSGLLDQFQHISETETDLDKLETSAKAFLDDPVDYPAGLHNTDYIRQYASEVNRIQVKMAEITSERSRRKIADTQTPVEQAQKLAKSMTEVGKYQDALSAIDQAAQKFPSADFSALKEWVNDDAKKNWDATKDVVGNLYQDYEAIGSSEATRKDALEKARIKLHYLIDNCGIAEYVDQAKQLLAKYPE